MGIVIISGSCCIPGMAVFDEQARRIVQQAITETGVEAQVRMMPATSAYFGGVPREVMAQIMNVFNQTGRMPLPAVLVNGKAVSYGVPNVEDIKAVLSEIINAKPSQEEHTHE